MSLGLKSIIKQACATFGVADRMVRSHRSELLVLCYHGVVANPRSERWSYENWVTADEFRAQLRWLRTVAEPADIDAVQAWDEGRWAKDKGPALLTFDDGYRNNLTLAAPILKEEGFPAVFFLSTDYIGSGRTLWNDEVRVRVVEWTGETIDLPAGGFVPVPAETWERRLLADRITQEAKTLGQVPCELYLKYLRDRTRPTQTMDDAEAREFMSWDDARKLVALGFEIGSHTVTHPILSRLERPAIRWELRESKARIEAELGVPCRTIGYPNGTDQDVSGPVIEEVRAAGFEWGFMTTPTWQKRGGDRFRVARMGFPGHTDLATFQFYATGLHARLKQAA